LGALTSKPYTYKTRPWEIKNKTTISVNDPSFPMIKTSIVNDNVVRILPSVGTEEWISNKVRFSNNISKKNQSIDHEITITSKFNLHKSQLQEIDINHLKQTKEKQIHKNVLDIETNSYMALSQKSITDINKYSTIRFSDILNNNLNNQREDTNVLPTMIDIYELDDDGFVKENVFEDNTVFLLLNYEACLPVFNLAINTFQDNDGELYALTLTEKQDVDYLGFSKIASIKSRNGFIQTTKVPVFLNDLNL
jgi:NADH dehydrogenase/NADH:ubiquinone oxidoreductase subunit G